MAEIWEINISFDIKSFKKTLSDKEKTFPISFLFLEFANSIVLFNYYLII